MFEALLSLAVGMTAEIFVFTVKAAVVTAVVTFLLKQWRRKF